MLIKTIVDGTFENAKLYKSYWRADGAEDFQDIELKLAEITFDYESSSDAGDGRDDYYTEENDEQIVLAACIIKDGQLLGVMCESFDEQRFLLLDYPETVIYHPGNYGGRNYHFYRDKRFKLIRKN